MVIKERMEKKKAVLTPIFIMGVFILTVLSCRIPSEQDQFVENTPTQPFIFDQGNSTFQPTREEKVTLQGGQQIGPFVSIMAFKSAPHGEIKDGQTSKDGSLWVTSDEGIFSLQKQVWHEISDSAAGAILGEDKSGRIWFLTDQGNSITAVKGGQMTKYDQSKGWELLLDDGYLLGYDNDGLVEDGKGNIWLATGQDDLRRYNQGTDSWEKITSSQIGIKQTDVYGKSDHQITDVVLTKDAKVWVATCSSSIQTITGQGVQVYDGFHWSALSETGGQCVMDMEADSSGIIWVGGFNQLMAYDQSNQKWENIGLPPYERRQLVLSIDLDPQDRPWVEVGLGGGASLWGATVRYHLEGYQWVEDLNQNNWLLSDITFNHKDEGWLCAEGIIYRYREGKMTQMAEMQTYTCKTAANQSGEVFVIGLDGPDAGVWQLTGEVNP